MISARTHRRLLSEGGFSQPEFLDLPVDFRSVSLPAIVVFSLVEVRSDLFLPQLAVRGMEAAVIHF